VGRPEDLLYSKEHEWVRVDGDTATIGITDYAADSMGDIVYVELPKIGAPVKQFGNTGVVESVKAVSDLYTPVSGEVVEINDLLENDPAVVNTDPFGNGWLFKVRLEGGARPDGLLDANEYERLTAE
jgi:glycine cleavage system H protein